MSVDDRLRRGLEANAQSFQPHGEARLDLVRRRWRRRRLVLAGVVMGVVLLAGSGAALGWSVIGGGPSGGRGVDPVDAPSGTLAPPHPVIPASNWRKVVTRDELAAAGSGQAFLREHLGSARRMPVLLSFSQDVFSQSARYAGGWSGGDAGRVSYDDWRLGSGELHLSDATGALDPVERVMLLGTWRSADG